MGGTAPWGHCSADMAACSGTARDWWSEARAVVPYASRVDRSAHRGASASAIMRPFRTPWALGRGSVRSWWGIAKGQLGVIGSLEERCPLIRVGSADRVAVPGRFCVPCVNAPPEFVGRYVEVVQFDADAKATRCRPELITFCSCPQPEIEDDAQAEAQHLVGKVPERPTRTRRLAGD
jgi:hypothetical protein